MALNLSKIVNYFDHLPKDPQKREESLIEEHLIKPILSDLGWHYHSQHTFNVSGINIKPDQTLYLEETPIPSEDKMMVVEESKAWYIDLDKKIGTQKETPHFQLLFYMTLLPVKYGFLTNGKIWRLYYKVNTISYIDFDLEKIMLDNDEETFEDFKKYFGVKSYQKNVLESSFNEKIKETRKLEEDLRNVIYDKTIELIGQSIDNGGDAKIIYRASLLLLYRILFLAYAESRNFLPVQEKSYYHYSFSRIVDELDNFQPIENSFDIYSRLKDLFSIVDKGEKELFVPPYNGGLFSEKNQRFAKEISLLDNSKINDVTIVEVIKSLMTREGSKVDYGMLDVKRLGSIYEGLMEYTFERAKTDLYLINEKGFQIYVEDPMDLKVIKKIPKGLIYLTKHNNIRKSSGSYYTPDDLVEVMVKNAVDFYANPKIERWRKELSDAMKKGVETYSIFQKVISGQLLDIKIVDSAMGSGHFLVSTVRYLSQKIMAFLGEFPLQDIYDEFEKLKSEIKENAVVDTNPSDEDILKRIIAKDCIYGVDANEMAVELAKLSLWLETIIPGVPLSFLSHHLRCGNSLVGSDIDYVLDSISQKITPMFATTIEETINKLSEKLSKLVDLKDITIDEVKQSEKSFMEVEKSVEPIRKLLDIEAASRYPGYEKLFNFWKELFTGDSLENLLIFNRIRNDIQKEIESFRRDINPFHWFLEFPEIKKRGGFDIVIGNPPWDKVKFEDEMFITKYEPTYRRYKRDKKKKIKESILRSHKNEYDEEKNKIDKFKEYVKNTYKFYADKGDVNLFRVFIERSVQILKKEGILEYLVPDGIYREEASDSLRKFLIKKNQLKAIYAFENRREEGGKFFEIDGRMKFEILEVVKGLQTGIIKSFFMARSVDESPMDYSVELLKKMSPDHFSFLEFKDRKDIKIVEKLYSEFSPLNQTNWIDFGNDLHMTNDSNYFYEKEADFPLYEGKMINQYRDDAKPPQYFLVEKEMKEIKRFFNDSDQKWCWENFRVAFRAQASSTNVRSLITTIIPKNVLCGHSLYVTKGDLEIKDQLFAVSIMNSFILDFLLRFMISSNVSKTYVERLPIPKPDPSLPNFYKIIENSAQLICINSKFDEISNKIGVKGITDREKREKIQGEIDAMVAKIFNLSVDEFEYILESVKAGKDSDTPLKRHYDRIKAHAIDKFKKIMKQSK